MVPALDRASVGITEALAADLNYRVDPRTTYSTASRTIAGSLRTSRHTYGTAFDINANRNPHRSDNRLITDLPKWWTESFRDAGFCWGGLWIGSKDTMHFAWQGPAFSQYEEIPLPYEPLTRHAPFKLVRSFTVVPTAPAQAIGAVLVDSDNNGARDVAWVSVSGDDVTIDASVASWQHNACSVRRSTANGLAPVAERSLSFGFGDWDGEGGQDLWFVSDKNGHLRLTVRTAFGGFAREMATDTDVPTPSSHAWISTGDGNVDGHLDLFVIDDGSLTIWDLDLTSGQTSIQSVAPLPFPPSTLMVYALGDADLDNRPDLWAISNGMVQTALAADGYSSIYQTQWPTALPDLITDASVSDYDGDGRVDLITFDGVRKQVWLGNTPLPDGLPLEVWFAAEEPECDDPRGFSGATTELRFTSSRWIASGVHEWRTRNGLDPGCDPEDEACDPGFVTHQDFAEFLAWVDNLPIPDAPDTGAAPRALFHAGYDITCALDDDTCWRQPMPSAEVSARLGMFLQLRSGVDVAHHRWVLSRPIVPRATSLPR
jgi:hypothetical protein